MSRPIIEIRNLAKCYRLGAIGATSLREETSRLWDRLRGIPHPDMQEFWALRDVSFDVQPGEVVGVIGRNGAGKSTLLKILSRITEPTSGSARLRGRVASLLEVGTGFHPELTGRENVYLNGAILGMTRAEIRRKFDEIVAFAEVERFIDTPVKRYSSGMYVRLAFSVAAHLEPEILIVDEVLAVGDAQFQKRCLGKMRSVSTSEGRTVLFVSHNMAAVSQLADRVVLLEKGGVRVDGTTAAGIAEYLGGQDGMATSYDVSQAPRTYQGNGEARFVRLWFARDTPLFPSGAALEFRFTATAGAGDLRQMRVSLTVFTSDGIAVGSGFSPDDLELPAGANRTFGVRIASLPLAPGQYYLGLAIGRGDNTKGHVDFDVVTEVLRFEVLPPEGDGGTVSAWPRNWGSIIISPVEAKRVP